MRLIVHHRAVCVSTEVGILLGKIKIIGVLFSGGKAGGGSGGQKWMVKVPRPSQKISYNLFRDTFCQEFVHSESLEVGAQKFWYSVLYRFLVHNSMKLISIKSVVNLLQMQWRNSNSNKCEGVHFNSGDESCWDFLQQFISLWII